jgi:hypothetical protein
MPHLNRKLMTKKNGEKMNLTLRSQFIMFLVLTSFTGTALPISAKKDPSTTITNLKVQTAEIPLAVEDPNPVFSRQQEKNSPP